jgi:hypothetical protein
MNWKGFEGISRCSMEALLWRPEMVEKPQEISQVSYRGL